VLGEEPHQQLVRGQVPGTTLRFMRDPRQAGRAYALHVPDDYRGDEPFPLTIVLGGGPGRALPTAQVARDEVEARGALAVFPQANGMWWDEQAGTGFEALLRELLQELNVDTDRVTISGYSNGGTGTLLYASRRPDRFAAYVSLMGGGLPFFEQDSPLDPAGFVHLPALFVHGERDEVIPSWASERTVKALRRARADAPVALHLLRERPHDVRHGRDEGLSFPFLERAVRDPFPRRVALRARDRAQARAYWVEVLQKGGGTGSLDAEIEGQVITLRTRGVKRLALHLRRELVDLARPVTVRLDGRETFSGLVREDPALFLRSWRETGDPQLASGARLELDRP
jgi:dienelactone hydrolase